MKRLDNAIIKRAFRGYDRLDPDEEFINYLPKVSDSRQKLDDCLVTVSNKALYVASKFPPRFYRVPWEYVQSCLKLGSPIDVRLGITWYRNKYQPEISEKDQEDVFLLNSHTPKSKSWLGVDDSIDQMLTSLIIHSETVICNEWKGTFIVRPIAGTLRILMQEIGKMPKDNPAEMESIGRELAQAGKKMQEIIENNEGKYQFSSRSPEII